MRPVFLISDGLVTPGGVGGPSNLAALSQGVPRVSMFDGWGPVARLTPDAEALLLKLRDEKAHRDADRAVALGVLSARLAAHSPAAESLGISREDIGVVVATSRGATSLLEDEHERFLNVQRVSTWASPMTTAGAFAAAVARDQELGGISMTLSSACSGGLNAIGVAASMISAKTIDHALAGGAEASLTPFTLAQLRAAQVLAKRPSILFPSRPMHGARCGLVPGEGAALVFLSAVKPAFGPRIEVRGFGSATEPASRTGVSEGGAAVIRAVRSALAAAEIKPGDIDVVVGHGASTVKGDAAEWSAYRTIFEETVPPVVFHKWLTGHMLGAAGAFSVAMGALHLAQGSVPDLPYWDTETLCPRPKQMLACAATALIVAMGFGGNASAIVLTQER